MSGDRLAQLAVLLRQIEECHLNTASLFEEHLHPDDAAVLARDLRRLAALAGESALLIEEGKFD